MWATSDVLYVCVEEERGREGGREGGSDDVSERSVVVMNLSKVEN